MNTRTFLKTLCLVPVGAVVDNLPGQGAGKVEMEMGKKALENTELCKTPDGIKVGFYARGTFSSMREVMIDNGMLTPEGNPTGKYASYLKLIGRRQEYEQANLLKDPRLGSNC